MKKQSLLLLGGALLAFASCQQEAATGGYTQEQVDSMVNVRVQEQMVALQAANDSTINALAQWKADSIIAAMKGVAPKTPRPTTTTTTKNTKVNNGGGSTKQEPSTIGNGKPKAGNDDGNTIGNGKPKAGNQDQGTIGNGKPRAGNPN